jgi:hypothetical protein
METYTYPPVEDRRAQELIQRPIVEPRRSTIFGRALNAVTKHPTRGQFAHLFLPEIGAQITTHNLVAMMSWMQAEGDAGANNPINSTHTMPGSTDFNWVHVQNYVSLASGVKATAMTLNYGADRGFYGYRDIRAALRENLSAIHALEAVEDSSWGTGGLAVRVLEETGWHELMSNRYLHHRLAT